MNSLRNSRLNLGYSQEKLSQLTGIAQANISTYEKGIKKPTDKTKEKIERVLGKLDWIESEGIQLKESSWQIAEAHFKGMIEATLLMGKFERAKFNLLVLKYFKTIRK
jgi:transcriptional regulator with XRE-family HTH domain